MLRGFAGAALLVEPLFEVADALLEIQTNAAPALAGTIGATTRLRGRNEIAHPQVGAVLAVGEARIHGNFTRRQQLANRADRGWPVKLVFAHLDEVIHFQLGHHWRLDPGPGIG